MTHSHASNLGQATSNARAALLMPRVGQLLLRRIRYIGAFLYWSQYHCSFSRAAWVCAFSGIKW